MNYPYGYNRHFSEWTATIFHSKHRKARVSRAKARHHA